MEDITVSKSIKESESYLKSILGDSVDIIYRYFIIPGLNNSKAFIIYVDGITNIDSINSAILSPLMNSKNLLQNSGNTAEDPSKIIIESGIYTPSVNLRDNWNEICDSVISGDTAMFIEGSTFAVLHDTKGWETRPIGEPLTEAEIRGPRDGFAESLVTNTSLIRRRIRDYGLRMEPLRIGERTKTDIVISYIDDLVDKGILSELKNRLGRIKIDSILESGYIEEFIEDSPYSIFPQVERTERPDKVSAAILEGRIAIFTDNTPFVLIVPTTFWEFIQAPGDYYEKYFLGTFLRIIRIIALVASLTLTPLYVVLSSYHQEMYPTTMALKVAAGREGIPFPAIGEAVLMEVTFEIMREAGIRMPRPVGQALSIVGALVIGEAAVSAGLAAPFLVVVVAASGISSFAIPAYNTSMALRLLRFPLLLLSGVLGILGFLVGTIVITMHLLSLRSFGAPYLAPVNPWRSEENRDVAVRAPWWALNKRPRLSSTKNPRRQTRQDLRPRPPSKPESKDETDGSR